MPEKEVWMLIFRKSNTKASSRQQIRIKEVRDDILLLPGNKYCSVVETSSINFELKSSDEQDVLIDSFQNFLNALPCQLQIIIRVRELDVDHYLEQLTQSGHKEKEKVYKEQIGNYCEFIKDLISGNKILSRRFYIIIPYIPKEKGDFAFFKAQVLLKQDIVVKGLEKMGMKATPLDSLEILDLFYSFYNSKQSKVQELKAQTVQALLGDTYAI